MNVTAPLTCTTARQLFAGFRQRLSPGKERKSVRVCVPLLSGMNDGSADESALAAHFGLAGRFAVIDSLNGEILSECAIAGVCRGPCGCPLPDLATSKVDVIATASVGFRLLQLSRRAGVPVLASSARTLGELRRELVTDRMRPVAAAVCVSNSRAAVAGVRR